MPAWVAAWGEGALMYLGIGAFFAALERLFTFQQQNILRARFHEDVFYALVNNVIGTLAGTALLLAVMYCLVKVGVYDYEMLRTGWGPISRLPVLVQAFLCVAIRDFIGYWIHRWSHKPFLWRYHLVHHQVKEVDWLTSLRFHPLNYLLIRFRTTPLFFMGFSMEAVLSMLLFPRLLTLFSHSNLNWTLGPLKYVLANPVFHRWHHQAPEDGGDMNYGAVFTVWDQLFGTYYMPEGRLPTKLGTEEDPQGLKAQLLYPFRKTER